MRRAGAILLFLAALLCAGLALAYDFPPLTGRIVDAANVIPDATKAALEPKLQTLEEKSGIQLVVATVNSLDGDEIEPYANALFRDWKLGEKDKNNGVLLLIAPNQHRVRIEVGYGLEGTLTDALSKIIISNAMAPRFKAGDYGGGVERGVDDIITVLTTDASEWQKRPDLRLDHRDSATDSLTPWIVLALFVVIVILLTRAPRVGAQAGYSTGDPRWGKGALQERAPAERDYFWSNLLSFILGMLANSGGRGGGWGDGGGFGGGGGFSGGGGSSGGGGASGSW
ncbi:TPM domain-containing protein [Methylocella sp.]|uniref:TPM domain-containing protein n=1 Tax=Methylocella sp. TaxID=1978226 RepID=UPI003C76A558